MSGKVINQQQRPVLTIKSWILLNLFHQSFKYILAGVTQDSGGPYTARQERKWQEERNKGKEERKKDGNNEKQIPAYARGSHLSVHKGLTLSTP